MTEIEKNYTDFEDSDIEEIAIRRLENLANEKNFVPFEDVLKRFNITQKDIDETADVDFE